MRWGKGRLARQIFDWDGTGYSPGETVNVIGGTGSGGTGTVTLIGFLDLDTPIIFPVEVGNALVTKALTQEVIMNKNDKLKFVVANIANTANITINGTLNVRA